MTPKASLPASLEARVWAALAEINDPEMPVNLVDLGLIYGLEVGEGTVRLRLTFTAMGCPASDMIAVAGGAGHRRGRDRCRLGSALDLGSPDAGWPGGAAGLGARRLMAYSRVHANVREYDVFARKARVEPLRQVGSVVAPDDDLAMAYARATYDEERWVEMMIVPRDAVIRLWGPGESET